MPDLFSLLLAESSIPIYDIFGLCKNNENIALNYT
jgi:hypothetical protein